MSLSPKFMKSLRKQVMELYYSCNQGYTPWNPTPYQPHDLGYNTYQSNGFGDAYYGYEGPPPPYPPSQGNFEDIFQVLLQERKEFWETQRRLEAQLATVTELVTRLVTLSAATSQPLNSGDLPSQAMLIPRRSIPTMFLFANQEGREVAPLNEGDVENINHEEVRECLEEVEEKNEDQEVENVDHEVENKDKEQKGMEIVHSASSKATPSKLPSELQFEWVNFSKLNFIGPQHYELGSEFKAYSGYLHKLHNNRTKVRALSSTKHLGSWKFQEKLVDSQNNGWTNQVWDPGKSNKSQHFWRFITYLGVLANLIYMTWNLIGNTKSKHWWRFIASIEALRSLVHVVWDTRDQCNNKNWWRFQEEFKHKPP
ncbi:hypothetical protein PIB30_078889 [Stylosanthes scabra]|uniref:Uncharacterized protein n=1 Tax=Stylosanthes scabra TaxID=79078 RepID=A0ABU6ZPJ6_9FABA|nr:hypothetical protein [Stylosanthes scabra]